MIRSAIYLLASAAIWGAEGYVFSRFLGFNLWQTVLLALVYGALFALALGSLLRLARSANETSMPLWRYLSLAPMLTLILGSFVSLPLLLFIAALGRIGAG